MLATMSHAQVDNVKPFDRERDNVNFMHFTPSTFEEEKRESYANIEAAIDTEKAAGALWADTISALVHRFGYGAYQSWFSKIFLFSYDKHKVVIAAPTRFVHDWIYANYFDVIKNIIRSIEPDILFVDLVVTSIPEITSNPLSRSANTEAYNVSQHQPVNETYAQVQMSSDNVHAMMSPKIEETNRTQDMMLSDGTFDERCTFDSFVVGTSNELAYAAARTVAESECAVPKSNPLFLYGGVGLGKTHLMHAIGLYTKQHYPNKRVIYMSAEKFMYQFIKALREKDLISFKDRFRQVDILMIDDIQFICGKDSTQEEFFHTFNALIDCNRQMVISCDRSPSDLDNIEERIKSRLGWGLVADVHSTTYELRLGILQSKVEQMKLNVPDNVLEFIAAKVTSNVRELEGALNKVVAHSNFVGKSITLEKTQELLRDLLRSNDKQLTIEDIQRKVADHYNMKLSDLLSAKRTRCVARPRHIAMFLCKTMTTRSLSEIGRKFGNKDHTTVMHAVKQVTNLLETDAEVIEEVRLLERVLQS